MQLRRNDWTRRAEPAELPELMDEPCTYEEFRACVKDLASVNRFSLGYAPTLKFLDEIAAKKGSTRSLKILDVGFGGGDALRRIAIWAEAKGMKVELAGIDLNPYAAKAAREQDTDGNPIQWVTGDAFSWDQPADVVISSLFTHHLPTPEIVRFLAWMEGSSHLGWFVNDLERSASSARWFKVLSRVMFWHRFVRHDGPISFQRSFVVQDWERMLLQAGLNLTSCSIEKHKPGRLCVSRVK